MARRLSFLSLSVVLTALLAGSYAAAVTPPGIVFESEAVCEPQSAWEQDKRSPNHWTLWTQEEDIEQKRSGGAVLCSPTVPEDRATPEEGAPPLHAVVRDLKPGCYLAYLSAPGRPLGYSLDGKQWTKYAGGELTLGLIDTRTKPFELWVDDRYANPPSAPGSGYFDYLRFIPAPDGAADCNIIRSWPGLGDWATQHGTSIGGADLTGAGAPAAAGHRLSYRFEQPGKLYLGVEIDDTPGAESARLSLNDRLIGGLIADGAGGQMLFAVKQPVEVKAGDTFVIEPLPGTVPLRVRQVVLSRDPIVEPPVEIQNLMVWSPEPGTTHFCWTTSKLCPTGVVEYGVGGELQQTEPQTAQARNHRAILTGLDPTQSYTAQVRTEDTASQAVTSDKLTFRSTPPTPAATKPFQIPLTVAEPTGAGRQGWPAVVGLPFDKGALASTADLRVLDAQGQPVPSQAELFSRWPDGSVKWATIAFVANSTAGQPTAYTLDAAPGAGQSNGAPLVTVTEQADRWQVTSDALRFELGKALPALFSQVAFDRNGDGRIAADETIQAKALGANLKLELADGSFLTCGPPEDGLRVDANGPVRAILSWSGPLTDGKGKLAWHYLARVTLSRGRPGMELNLTVGNDQRDPQYARINALALRVPLDGELAGGLEGDPEAKAPAPDGWTIQQDHDNHFALHTSAGDSEGEHAAGVATGAAGGVRVSVAIRDFWQTYPSGFAIKPDAVHVRLLPWLDEQAYTSPEDLQEYHKLYVWCRDGKYVFKAGQVTQQRVAVNYTPASQKVDAKRWAAWVNEPLVPQAAPSYLCGTAVLGRAIFPRTKGVWDSYEEYFEAGFEDFLENRERERSYGWMHYGDWYGERRLNYGNNEYDLPFALGVQWLRSGNRAMLDRGEQMARHYSTVDTVIGGFAEKQNGRVYEHSFNHLGTDLSPDSPLLEAGNIAGYTKDFGSGMMRGAIDRQGHVFDAGNWLYAALTGDPWFREVAEMVATNQAVYLTPNYDFGIERSGGWPLINATNAYGFSGNPFYLNAARLMIERTLQRQDPVTGGWLHRPPPSETDGEEVLGGKAFAVGILSHGILRYLEQEPESRPEVEHMLVRGADWLMNESWCPGKGFRYISSARKFKNSGGRGLTSLLDSECIAAAYDFTRDRKYLDFWRLLMQGTLNGAAPAMGKSFTQATRQTIFALDRIRAYGVNDASAPAEVMLRQQVTVRNGQVTLRALASNPARGPAEATLTLRGTDQSVKWTLEPRGQALSPPLVVQARPGTKLELEVTLTGASPVVKTVEVIAEPPLPALRRGTGVAYVGPVENATRRALTAIGQELPVITDPAATDLAKYAGLMIGCDSWGSAQVDLPASAGRFADFVRAGGRLAIWQINDDSWSPEYLPLDLYAFEDNSRLGQVTAPNDPLFDQVGKLDGAMMYDTLGPVAAPWRVLATDANGQPAMLEATMGRGRVLVIEPSLDRYAAGEGDSPDNAVSQAAARQFMRNLLAWLQAR